MMKLIRQFLRDRCAGLSVEFVIGMPLIMGAQAIAFDAGRVIMNQHALEAGVREATRFLARANLTDCPDPGTTYYSTYKRMVVTSVRASVDAADITCSFTTIYDGTGDVLRRDFVRIRVAAEIEVTTALFSAWGDITIAAEDQARFIGE